MLVLPLKHLLIYLVCVERLGHMLCVCAEATGQFAGVTSLLLPRGSQGRQDWQRVFLPEELHVN